MKKIILLITILSGMGLTPSLVFAMAPGTLLYRTGGGAKMFGYQGPLIETEKGIIQSVNAGHVAIYVGKEDGVDYIVEATAQGIVKTPAEYFVNRADNEAFLGARLPSGLSPLRQARAVAIAKSLAESNLAYDFDFHRQKGAWSGDWTCVGLTEKIYESADIPNPNNIGALEYDRRYYAVDITPDGYDNTSPADEYGDRFSSRWEFSQIARRQSLLFPAPELIGFDAGVEKDGERYLFLPYTQFIQPSLTAVPADIKIYSSFSSPAVRGETNWLAIGLRWSLINNPLSSFKELTVKAADMVKKAAGRLFGAGTDGEVIFVADDPAEQRVVEDGGTVTFPAVTVTKGTPVSGGQEKPVVASAAGKKYASDVASGTKDKTGSRIVVNSQAGSAASASEPSIVKAATTPPVAAYGGAANQVSASNTAVVTADKEALSAEDAPPLVQISMIYATGNNDFVELYNPGSQDIDLAAAGYRLEKTKTAEDPSLIMRLGNPADGSYPGGTVIKAKGKYLIVRSDASLFHKARAQAIATRPDFSFGGSGYTLYLGTAAISSSRDEDIREAVGFGAATYYQGGTPAPEISDNYVLERIGTNGDNSRDFRLAASDDPDIVWNVDPPQEEENAEEENEEEESEGGAEDDPPEEPAEEMPLALINKIYATASDDWIEIRNESGRDFDLAAAGYRLEKTKTAEDPSLIMRIGDEADGVYPGGTVIPAGGTYRIVRAEASEFYRSAADAVATRTEFVWTGKDYTIYLATGPVSSSQDPDIVDAVGFGAGATFFAGSAPAPEITDRYILSRIGESNNNAQDFVLVPTDEPLPPEDSGEDEGRFASPIPIESAGLVNLWHFDECYGTGKWVVGRWDCAQDFDEHGSGISLPFDPAPELDRFTLSLLYKSNSDNPGLRLSLHGATSTSPLIILDEGMITVSDLPETKGQYRNLPILTDDAWHRFTLVVNQPEDYWAIYIDGEEAIRESFMAEVRAVDRLDIRSAFWSTYADEVAVWHRPLSQAEIRADVLREAPYAPLAARPPQAAPALLHLWEFEEDEGTAAVDQVSGAVITVDPSHWSSRRHGNYAIKTSPDIPIIGQANVPLGSRDLSLAFWWRNSSYPEDGEAKIIFKESAGSDKNLFGLETSYYRLGYHFNGAYDIFAQGFGVGLPQDDKWHHIALVYDSYRYRLNLYVDGEERFSRPHIWMLESGSLGYFDIRTGVPPSIVDDLRLYRGALQAEEIGEIYANTK